jgi:hypothetical protein
VLEFVQIYITMALATFAGMMLGLFASALAPNSSSAPLIVIILMLPQIVLAGALIPVPSFVSAPFSTRWAFESLIAISGSGSDVAADVCWALPPDVRNAMTLEDKLANNCKCLGVNMLKEESCNHPGLGKFRIALVDQPLPVPPNHSPLNLFAQLSLKINRTMLPWPNSLRKLKVYEAEVEIYKEKVNQYQSEIAAYETANAQLRVAVAPAEAVVRTFYNGSGFAYVDKNDHWLITPRSLLHGLCSFSFLILFGAILYLQKRKDVI